MQIPNGLWKSKSKLSLGFRFPNRVWKSTSKIGKLFAPQQQGEWCGFHGYHNQRP